MTVFTKGKTMGDLVVHYESTQANLFSATLLTGAGTPHNIANVVGYPVSYNKTTKVATLLLAAAQANANGFLIAGPAVVALGAAATTLERYTVIIGSNVVINQDNIATVDSIGSAFTTATIIGGAGLADMRFVTGPATKLTQTE